MLASVATSEGREGAVAFLSFAVEVLDSIQAGPSFKWHDGITLA